MILLSATSWPTIADSGKENWRWYYSSFSSPELSATIFIRNGTAQVTMNNKKIKIIFNEPALPEENPVFNGTYYQNKVIGMLSNFFPSRGESLSGVLETKKYGECNFMEIVLRSGVPDSSMLVISKIDGNCQ